MLRRTKAAHKLPRASCRFLCNQDILQNQSGCTCQTAGGQHFSSDIHQQNGEGGIQGSDRSQRLEIESNPVPVQKWRPLEVDLFASQLTCQLPLTVVCELETRPFGHSNRFVFNELGENQRVCISHICTNRAMLTPGNVPEGRKVGPSGSCMASTTLVPSTVAISSRSAFAISDYSGAFNERQSDSSADQSATSWVAAVSQRYQATGISKETRDILLAAWRRNTSSAYSYLEQMG